MKKYLKNSFFLAIVLMMCLACSEDSGNDEGSTLPETRLNLLAGKIWRLSGTTVDPARPRIPGEPPITDWYADMEPCEQDDQKVYFFNGDLVFDEGPTRCLDTNVQTFTGSWTFNSDETIITELQQNFINIIFSYKVLELSENILIIERQQRFLGDPLTYTFVESYEAI